jgi:hypothetical protein
MADRSQARWRSEVNAADQPEAIAAQLRSEQTRPARDWLAELADPKFFQKRGEEIDPSLADDGEAAA